MRQLQLHVIGMHKSAKTMLVLKVPQTCVNGRNDGTLGEHLRCSNSRVLEFQFLHFVQALYMRQ